MACVICGKKQRTISVNTVKYASQNTLPEVLSSVIGNKISSDDWNEGGKRICQVCNRQCEEYDKLSAKLQDLKEYLLQEYTKRIYRESQSHTTQDNGEQGGKIPDEDESTTGGGKRTKDVSESSEKEKEDLVLDDTAGDSEKRKKDGTEPSEKEKEDIELDDTTGDSEKRKKDVTEADGKEEEDIDPNDEEKGDLTKKRRSQKLNVTEKDEMEEGIDKEGTDEDDIVGDSEKRKKDEAEARGNEKEDIEPEDKSKSDFTETRGRKKKNQTDKDEKKSGVEEGKEKGDIPDEKETATEGENRQEDETEASGEEKDDKKSECKEKGNLTKKRGRKKINVPDKEKEGRVEEQIDGDETAGVSEKEKKDGTEPSGNETDIDIEPEHKKNDGFTKKRGRKKRNVTDKDKEKESGVKEGKEKESEKANDSEGGDENESNTNVKKTIQDGDADVSKAPTEADSENLPIVIVKLEIDDGDETTSHIDLSLSQENLPDRVVDDSTGVVIDENVSKQVTRLTEKSNLVRLPDFEYQQWYSLDGYCYKLHTQNTRGQLLKCHKSGCVVSARVTKQGALVKIVGEHAHEPDRRIAERNKLYAKLKTRCMSDATTPLITIYEEEAQRFPGGASCLPFPEVRMREWRAANDHTVVIHTDGSTLEESSKRFQCDVCSMGFNSSRLLTRHADKHNQSKTVGRVRLSGGKSYVASTPTAASMKIQSIMDKKRKRVLHKLQENGDESVAESETEEAVGDECHLCRKSFATLKQLKQHIVTEHSGDMLMCVHCEIAFDTPLLLQRHKTSCRKCCDERIMQRHRKQRDSDLALQLANITGQGDDMGQDENDPNWDVTQANESTADEGEEDFSISPKKKRGPAPSKVNKCRVCRKSFPNQQQLTTHLYTHSSKKRYECSICGSHFNKKAVLTRHMLSENHRGRIKINPPRIDVELWGASQGIRCTWACKYECAVCSGTYSERAALLRHMRDEKHITDEIIIHEAQPPSPADFWPRKRMRLPTAEVKQEPKPVDVRRREDAYPKLEGLDEPIEVGGLKFGSKREAMRAWYEFSGKKPLECAVCGEGFMTRIQLLAHMENTDHLSDSIVENVPVLEDLVSAAESHSEENQIVPAEQLVRPEEDAMEIKQESGRVEIISQVIFPPEESNQKMEAPDEEKPEPETDQTYYIQTENVNGETVMVIQGDLDGSLHDNMQLFMDEDGNIVTQDDEGNTVQVMHVDMSRVQHLQQDNADAGESQSDDADLQHNYIQLRQDEAGAGLHVDGTGQEDDELRPHAEESHYSAGDQAEIYQEHEEAKVDPDEILSQADPDEQSMTDDKSQIAFPPQAEETAETKAVHTPRKSTRNLDKSDKARTLEEELAVVKRLRRTRILK